MVQITETKIMPIQDQLSREIQELRFDMNTEFKAVRVEIANLREYMDVRFNSTEKMFYVLAVPIIGSTIGGLSIIFLKIYQAIK